MSLREDLTMEIVLHVTRRGREVSMFRVSGEGIDDGWPVAMWDAMINFYRWQEADGVAGYAGLADACEAWRAAQETADV